ncbi:MAG: hypothetical protein KA285_00865 [Bacteroidia bacterium]|nr:hypothetical protein [Bacteroidia bacterium]
MNREGLFLKTPLSEFERAVNYYSIEHSVDQEFERVVNYSIEHSVNQGRFYHWTYGAT